jgi:hypothetical protein
MQIQGSQWRGAELHDLSRAAAAKRAAPEELLMIVGK